MKNALLIVNPFSGKKKGERIAAEISNKLGERGIASKVFVSTRVSTMEQFLQGRPLKDFDFVGLVGGDGTMHTFLNAALRLYEQIPVPVALFPGGTGNAFNFDIGCNTIEETLNTIYAKKSAFIDIAEVTYGNERLWSFNIIGCGLVAEINKLAENLRWLGASRYTIASLIKLLANPSKQLAVTTDQGRFEGRFSFVLACNTRYTGKGMLMAPHAKLDDGKFDVTLVKACSAIKLLMLFPKIFKGQHLGADVLTYLQTSTLTVGSGLETLPTNIDGELKGHTPFSLNIQRGKVNVFMKSI